MSAPLTLEELIPKILLQLELKSRGPVVLVGDEHVSHAAIEALRDQLPDDVPLDPYVLSHEGPLVYDLVENQETRSGAPAIAFLHGLEYMRADQVRTLLTALNLGRDRILNSTSLLLLWVPEPLLDRFMAMCPDLFDWRNLLTPLSVPIHPKDLFQFQLVGCLARFSDLPEDTETVEFSPQEDGLAPPQELPWILDNGRRVWLASTDQEATARAIWTLAQQRIRRWLRKPEASTLIVPLLVGDEVEPPLSARHWATQNVGGWPVGQWVESDWACLVLLEAALLSGTTGEKPAAAAQEMSDAFPDARIAVVASPTDTPPSVAASKEPWITWTEAPYRIQNTRRLRKAGMSETALSRLEGLGMLDVPPAIARRLAESYEREGRLSRDDMGLLEIALQLPKAPDVEAMALEQLSDQDEVGLSFHTDEGGLRARLLRDGLAESVEGAVRIRSLAARLLLATRALVQSDFEDVPDQQDLKSRPEVRQVLHMALQRKASTHGAEWLQRHVDRSLVNALGNAANEIRTIGQLKDAVFQLEQIKKDLAPRTALSSAETPGPPRMADEAKKALSRTIRTLRTRLLADLHGAMNSAYLFSIPLEEARLSEATRIRRQRLEAWFEEQERADEARGEKKRRRKEDFRADVEKQAAYTLLNRLVILRLMEAAGLRKPLLVTGGRDSQAYKEFSEVAPDLVYTDEAEGYAFLLRLVFEDLAQDMPGLYGPAGLVDMVPIPASTLRTVVDAFDEKVLASCWTDDMTLGWIYQYWNDPEREALDAKLNAGGKVEPHEIASKTQMFTERYIVDWLLQNSLGPMWLAMCQKHGWTPEAESNGTLAALEERRVQWRQLRDAGEVDLTELMPLYSEEERRWAYFVPQPIPEDAVEQAPESVRNLKILDPAVGSGHFLVVAFDLLVALYKEEARHQGETGEEKWGDRAIVERILEHNLHGIDLDPRAVQIAAAALWLKAQQACREAEPRQMNLVASNLRLGSLPDDDPALLELRREVERETGIPGSLTDTIVQGLKGADHLGSLLKIDTAVENAILEHEDKMNIGPPTQRKLWGEDRPTKAEMVNRYEAKSTVLERIEWFLTYHSRGDDLGLKLRGEQLAAGVRFVRMLREESYEVVVGNPPYQGTSKMGEARYVRRQYPRGKADLYAAFIERCLQLARPSGISALVTMRNWMFIKQYADLRRWILETHDLRVIGDLRSGAFEEISAAQVVVSVVMTVTARRQPSDLSGTAMRFFDEETVLQVGETQRKRSAVLCQERRHEFNPTVLKVVPEWPMVYWWSRKELDLFSNYPLLGDVSPVRATQGLYNNSRFIRFSHEVFLDGIRLKPVRNSTSPKWVPLTNGASGLRWMEPLRIIANWGAHGFEPKTYMSTRTRQEVYNYANESSFFLPRGIAFAMIGSEFSARLSCWTGIFADMGRSVFASDYRELLALMNSSLAIRLMSGLNPTVHFTGGDVNRLPLFHIAESEEIVTTVESAFSSHESHREPSVGFRGPGPSPWRYAQDWAQAAVDRPEGAPLPLYSPEYDPEPLTDHLSFTLGVALGRLGASGEGILSPTQDNLNNTLPAGILFLDGTLDTNDLRDSLALDAAKPLHDAWTKYGPDIDLKSDLRTYLRIKFFPEVHKGMYENRPIHWPLSSEKKTFVAWINIHRWNENTLRVLLADHLRPALIRTDGELADVREARFGSDKKAARDAERRFATLKKWQDELQAFAEAVEQCAEKGAPPTDPKCPAREVDARYDPDLDDGVMINSAALWPLLEPQWKDPKKWWKELSTPKGRKDYDWSHLAMRYWPERVDEKCREDPSLGVAHGCFWAYHPGRAWAWELRLQDEIGPDFRIEEAPYRGAVGDTAHRETYLRDHGPEALETIEKEVLRRRRKTKKPQKELRILEPGLWSALPEDCWELETRLIKKQEHDFKLLAPDEGEARAAFEAARPGKARAREKLLRELEPIPTLLDDQLPPETPMAEESDSSGEEA